MARHRASEAAAEWAAKRREAAARAKALKEERDDLAPPRPPPRPTRRPVRPSKGQSFEERRRMAMHNRLIMSAKPRVSTQRATRPPALSGPQQHKLGAALARMGSFFFEPKSPSSTGSRVRFDRLSSPAPSASQPPPPAAGISPEFPGQRTARSESSGRTGRSDPKWGGLRVCVERPSAEPVRSPAERIKQSVSLASAGTMRDSLEELHSVLKEVCQESEDDQYDSDGTFESDEEEEEEEEALAGRVLARDQGRARGSPTEQSWEGAYFTKLDQELKDYSDQELLNRTSEMVEHLAEAAPAGTPQAAQLGSARQLLEQVKGVDRAGSLAGVRMPDWMAELGWGAASPAQKIRASQPQRSSKQLRTELAEIWTNRPASAAAGSS